MFSTFLIPGFLCLCLSNLKVLFFVVVVVFSFKVAILNFSNKFQHEESLLPLLTGTCYFQIGAALKSCLVPGWCFIFSSFCGLCVLFVQNARVVVHIVPSLPPPPFVI